MKNNEATDYLMDLGQLIKEKALDAKHNAQKTSDSYDVGVLMAYHDVITLMQSQAVAFGLSFEDIGLSGFDPNIDLL